MNGDGLDDLIVGAIDDDPNDSGSGASFVVFGGDFSGAATQVGTVGDDTPTGAGADDVIFAGTGNDTLDGGGGADRLSGGAGNDVFIFQDVGGTTTVIDFEGGAGAGDQLDVSAFGFADFAAFQAVASASGPGGHDTLIQLDADDSILLEDFDLGRLVADDVILFRRGTLTIGPAVTGPAGPDLCWLKLVSGKPGGHARPRRRVRRPCSIITFTAGERANERDQTAVARDQRLAPVQPMAGRAEGQPCLHHLPGRQAVPDRAQARWRALGLRAHLRPLHGAGRAPGAALDELALPALALREFSRSGGAARRL